MGAARCTSCRGRLPGLAWACPYCGAATSPLRLEPTASPEPEGDVADATGPTRRQGLLLAGAAVVVVAGAAALLGHPHAPLPGPVPPPTTVAPTPTTRAADGPPSLGRASAFFAGTSLFPGLTTGAEVVGLTADGSLYRVDLDNGGGVRRVPARSAGQPPAALIPRDGAMVLVTAGGEAWAIPDDSADTAVALGQDDHRYLAATDGQEIWRVPRFVGVGGAAEVVDVLTGRVLASHQLPSGALPLMDDARHGLLLATADGTYRLDGSSGVLARVAPAGVLGVSKRFLIVEACGDTQTCRIRTVDRTTGEPFPGGPLLTDDDRPSIGALAPGAGYVAFAPDAAGRPIVVLDVDDGTRVNLQSQTRAAPQWAPDGRTLVWLDGRGRLTAWRGGPVLTDERSSLPDLVAVALVPKRPAA